MIGYELCTDKIIVTVTPPLSHHANPASHLCDVKTAAAQFTAGLIIAFDKSWQLSLVLLAGIPVIGGATAMVTKVSKQIYFHIQIYSQKKNRYSNIFKHIQTYSNRILRAEVSL
jgi:ABC-type multidrug transport system fused ATPase/permease subunit